MDVTISDLAVYKEIVLHFSKSPLKNRNLLLSGSSTFSYANPPLPPPPPVKCSLIKTNL